MKIAIIGEAGHFESTVAAAAADASLSLLGGAPGPSHEGFAPPSMQGVAAYAAARGLELPLVQDYRALLDKQPDIAVVNPWFCDNAQVIVEALSRGIAVYAEKPLSITEEGLDAIEAALAGANTKEANANHTPPNTQPTEKTRSVSMMLETRYMPWFAAAKRAVDEGLLGDIYLVTAQKSYKFGGERPAFFYKREMYGGTIAWVGAHAIDWALWLLGEQPCWAEGAYRRMPGMGDIEMAAVTQFGFGSGAVASVQMDYLHQPSAARHDDDRVRVVGTKGTLEVRDQVAYLETAEQAMTPLPLEPKRNPLADFADSLRGGAPCRISAQDAVALTRATLLATRAADTGCRQYADKTEA